MLAEPVLSAEDRRIWDRWCRAARVHAGTQLHRRRVDRARAVVDDFASRTRRPYVAWSAGKDSTAMTHLACVDRDHRDWRVMSIKDDLDFPGEEEYVRALGAAWGLTALDVVHPPFSLQEWVREHCAGMDVGEDIHGRTAGLSRAAFYSVITAYAAEHQADGALLGLRAAESPGRNLNRATHGTIYAHHDGILRATPLADWQGLDVYGYLLTHGIEPLHVYRCCGLATSPEKVRKSWWLPGASVSSGATVWLHTYYPSLYRKLRELWPAASTGG